VDNLRKENKLQTSHLRKELDVTTLKAKLMTDVQSLVYLNEKMVLGLTDTDITYLDYDLRGLKAPEEGYDKVTAAYEALKEQDVDRKRQGDLEKVHADVRKVFIQVREDAEKLKESANLALTSSSPLYKNLVKEVKRHACQLPSSGAIAGIFAQVDANVGVWKAPANVSLAAVAQPWVQIDNQRQEDLNVDVTAGKSINAIRSFTGRGILVWGARTLAGNDNEWRYVPVRRFFNMVEKSVRLATHWAVFEPNAATTWVRVQAMIENFLTNQWKAGAMQGAKPSEAFFVRVGLGSTMTAVDVLEGRMNIEIGMAVVRPAEFIILKFSHKLPQS
jgi:hypothetical protein